MPSLQKPSRRCFPQADGHFLMKAVPAPHSKRKAFHSPTCFYFALRQYGFYRSFSSVTSLASALLEKVDRFLFLHRPVFCWNCTKLVLVKNSLIRLSSEGFAVPRLRLYCRRCAAFL